MVTPEDYALTAAKEITIAAVSVPTSASPLIDPDAVADFYEIVYKKILELVETFDKD